jgi:pimeloyl-ACP methyl ester carboxylesterase
LESTTNLFFRQIGSGNKHLIVLHGIFGSSDNWLTVAKKFDPDYTVWLVDQRNHGRSFWSEQFDYVSLAADLAQFITYYKLEKPVVLGHSMGGKVLMNFLGLYHEQIAAAIVVDIAPRGYQIHHRTIVDGLLALDLPTATSRQEVDDRLAVYVPELDTRQFLLKNLYRNDEGQFALRINLDVIDKNLDMVGDALDDSFVWNGQILFIRGANSHYVRDEDLPDLYRHYPFAAVETIQKAGHWVQAEQPDEFAKVLNTFLASLAVI